MDGRAAGQAEEEVRARAAVQEGWQLSLERWLYRVERASNGRMRSSTGRLGPMMSFCGKKQRSGGGGEGGQRSRERRLFFTLSAQASPKVHSNECSEGVRLKESSNLIAF